MGESTMGALPPGWSIDVRGGSRAFLSLIAPDGRVATFFSASPLVCEILGALHEDAARLQRPNPADEA